MSDDLRKKIRHVLDSRGIYESDGTYGVVGMEDLVTDLLAVVNEAGPRGAWVDCQHGDDHVAKDALAREAALRAGVEALTRDGSLSLTARNALRALLAERP